MWIFGGEFSMRRRFWLCSLWRRCLFQCFSIQ